MDIFKGLMPANNIQALYFFSLAYLYGNEVIQKNPQEAEKLLLKIEKLGEPRTTTDKMFYLSALNTLGWMFEKGFGRIKPDFNKAVAYYKKEYDFAGKFHIARLILTEKISGNYEQAKKILEDASSESNPNTLAAFLYGTMLIAEGNQHQGLCFLEKVDQKQEDTQPLASLQLGIAYQYGFGVEQNEIKAQEYFKKIMNDPIRAIDLYSYLGLLYLFGLGGHKKDVNKGLALIAESENKIDDVFFTTEQLFPIIKKLKAEQAAANAKAPFRRRSS